MNQIEDSRAFRRWSLIHGSSWSGLIMAGLCILFRSISNSRIHGDWELTICWQFLNCLIGCHFIKIVTNESLAAILLVHEWLRSPAWYGRMFGLVIWLWRPTVVTARWVGGKDEAVVTLRWRHNGRDSVSNHQPHDCLPNRLFRRRSKITSKLRVTGLCAGNSPVTGEFPAKGPVTRKMFPFDDVIMYIIPSTVIVVIYCRLQ